MGILFMESARKYIINNDNRIVAVRDFSNVCAGDIGGFVDSPYVLSHSGNCWIYDNARADRGARIFGNARVVRNAHVTNGSFIYDDAFISGHAFVSNVRVRNSARIVGNARVEDSDVYDHVIIGGDAIVTGGITLRDTGRVTHNAKLTGCFTLSGDYYLVDDADIREDSHVIGITGILPYNICVYRTVDGHSVQVGCQRFQLTDDITTIMQRAFNDQLPWYDHYAALIAALTPIVHSWH